MSTLLLSQVDDLLEMDWKTVKNIDKKYLKKEFAIPDYDDLRILGVNEISSKDEAIITLR